MEKMQEVLNYLNSFSTKVGYSASVSCQIIRNDQSKPIESSSKQIKLVPIGPVWWQSSRELKNTRTNQTFDKLNHMTTNKHIHLLPNKQSKLSWSRWTRANWQQPLCCDDMPLWHRLTAIVGLCRPWWWWWRWRWWWRRVKATVSLRCYSPVISTTGNCRRALR